jgi:hypothetical protein
MFRLSPHEVPARNPSPERVRNHAGRGQGAGPGLRQTPAPADRSDMRRIYLIALMLALGSTAGAQGIFEYWKAGAHTKRGKAPLPSTSPSSTVQHAPGSDARAHPPAGPAPWTHAWFADRAAVSRQIAALRDAVAAPMIGERYPLPRGGGFRCTPFDAAPHAPDDAEPWAMRCAGPDASCARENFFACQTPGAVPTLVQVRWTARVPAGAAAAEWRSHYQALADTLTRALGPPASADSTMFRWDRADHAITARIHGSFARPDSIEILARSSSLPAPRTESARR